MANSYDRRINLYINDKEFRNDAKSIRGEMTKLINAQARMEMGSKEYIETGKKIRLLDGVLKQHRAQLKSTSNVWFSMTNMASKFNKYIGVVASGLATVAAAFYGMKKLSDTANEFESRLDNLSALTGLEGEQLRWLGEEAKKTSVKVTDGNVRIKQSADDIVDAYTKVGSQRPELLKNKEALAGVTEDAIILSEAAKSDLEPAVKGLTTTMNQFNAPASDSRRIINAMAAGSKEGAADIPYLTQAIEKSGTTMHLMNLSLEQNIGLIEAIAPNYAKAEEAGNSLDKVFLKLKQKQIGYVNGTFDLDAALEELANRYKNGESAASLFGVEHAKMGELLVANRDAVDKYTKAVTGTNIAIEQAAKNTNNAQAMEAQARNEFRLSAIELGKNLSPAITKAYQMAGKLAQSFSDMISTPVSEKLKQDRIEMNNLFSVLKNTNTSTKTRKATLEKLNTTYSSYLPNLLSEHSTLVEIEAAQRAANDELMRNIQIKLRQEDLEKLGRQQKKIMDNILKDVKDKSGESLMSVAETEIFSILSKMGTMKSLDEAKNVIGAFAKQYRDASHNVGTYTENLKQFFALLKVQQQQEQIMNSINSLSKDDSTTPPIGTRKTFGDTVYEWDGKDWKKVSTITGGSGDTGGNSGAQSNVMSDGSLELPPYMQRELDNYKKLNEQKKQDAKDWEAFQKEVNDNIDKENQQFFEQQQWRDETERRSKENLVETQQRVATGMIGLLINLAGQQSAIGKALYAVQQALAIADIWIKNRATNAIIYSEALAQFALLGPGAPAAAAAWSAAPIAANNASAALNTGLIAAEVIANTISGYESGGFTNGDRIYRAGEKGLTEWISPNWMVNDPVTGPVIDWLEQARKRKVTMSPAVLDAAPFPQHASGGYTANPPSGGSGVPDTQQNKDIAAVLSRATDVLDNIQKKGIPASVKQLGDGGVLTELAKTMNFLKSLDK